MLRLLSAAALLPAALATAGTGAAVTVTLETKYNASCDQSFGGMFWLPASSLGSLGMPTTFCGSDCGTVAFAGKSFAVTQINPKDGHAACGTCRGCATAFVSLATPTVPTDLRPGQNVTMTYTKKSPGPSPPAPPPPAPPPPAPPPPAPPPPAPPSPAPPSPGAPPTRHIPLLSKQPAFCGKQFFTNYIWLAQSQLACLGIPAKGCGGGTCGTLSINGQVMNVTNINDDDHDVCGSCEGCPTSFVGFPVSLSAAAQAFEGKDAALVYRPLLAAGASSEQAPLPDCPALPSAWKALVDKQLSPACSKYESQGSLGTTATADQCLAKVKASGVLNYAAWSAKTKSCDVCAIRWRGPAENWQYSDAAGVTSFAWYEALPAPKPSGLCPVCPPDPGSGVAAATSAATSTPSGGQSTTILTLSNELMEAAFSSRGLSSLSSPMLSVAVGRDDFALALDGENCTCSSRLAEPTVHHMSANVVSFGYASPQQKLLINVTYELRPQSSAFISKTISLTDTSGANITRVVNSVSAMDGVALQGRGSGPTGPADTTSTSNAVQFFRWNDTHAPATRTVGAFLTAQNQFVQPPSLGWTLDQNWTTLDTHGAAAPRTLDSAIIGLYDGLQSQLEFAEAAAVTEVVSSYLVQVRKRHFLRHYI